MGKIAMENAPVPHSVTFEGMPAGEKVIELCESDSFALPRFHVCCWLTPQMVLETGLPTIGGCNISKLEIDDGATAAVAPDNRPRWLTYGSSITHCMGLDATGTARSPSRCWPAICAQKADVHLTNCGYGGECHVDQAVARMLRDMPVKPDGFSFKLGINIHNMTSMGKRGFASAVIGFLLTVRDGHPNTPIVVTSPVFGTWRETLGPSSAIFAPDEGQTVETQKQELMSLQTTRAQVKGVVEMLQGRGDKNVRQPIPSLSGSPSDYIHCRCFTGRQRLTGVCLVCVDLRAATLPRWAGVPW